MHSVPSLQDSQRIGQHVTLDYVTSRPTIVLSNLHLRARRCVGYFWEYICLMSPGMSSGCWPQRALHLPSSLLGRSYGPHTPVAIVLRARCARGVFRPLVMYTVQNQACKSQDNRSEAEDDELESKEE